MTDPPPSASSAAGPAGGRTRLSLQWRLMAGFALSVALPLATLAAITVTGYLRQGRQAAENRLHEAAISIRRQVDDYLRHHEAAVQSVALTATLLSGPDAPELHEWLARSHEQYPEFITMIGIDSVGRVTAASPLINEAGDSILASIASVEDRPYFQRPMQSGTTYVSPAFRGRGFGSDIIVAISAPVLGPDGEPVGVVEGSLEVGRFSLFGPDYASLVDAGIVIVDQDLRVVYASTGFEPLAAIEEEALITSMRARTDTLFHYLSDRGANDPVRIMAAAEPTTMAGWTVIVQQPDAVVVRRAIPFLWLEAGLGVTGLVLALGLAHLLSRQVTRPVSRLAAAVSRFDLHHPSPVSCPPGAPGELRELFAGFQQMTERLNRQLSGLLQICATCKHVRTESGSWEQIESYVRRRSDAEFSHGMCPRCEAQFYETYMNETR